MARISGTPNSTLPYSAIGYCYQERTNGHIPQQATKLDPQVTIGNLDDGSVSDVGKGEDENEDEDMEIMSLEPKLT